MKKYWIAVCTHDAFVFATVESEALTVAQLNEKTNWGAVQILPLVSYEMKGKGVKVSYPCDIPLIE